MVAFVVADSFLETSFSPILLYISIFFNGLLLSICKTLITGDGYISNVSSVET